MISYEPQISKLIFDAQCFAAQVLRPEHRGLRQRPWNPWYSDTAIEPSDLPFGKHTNNYGKSPFLVGKSTIFLWTFSIAMLNYQRVTSCVALVLLGVFYALVPWMIYWYSPFTMMIFHGSVFNHQRIDNPFHCTAQLWRISVLHSKYSIPFGYLT